MNILSIHSHVSFGHVGNSAAVFALQKLGCEVWPVHTVLFSNHPGYGSFTGRIVDAAEVAHLIEGIEKLGLLAKCDGVLSGYLGAPETGPVVLATVKAIRKVNPAVLYCCDPVLGDTSAGLYVRAGLPEFMRERAVPEADILTPNQFELEALSGQSVTTRADLIAALAGLHRRGPRIILVTSVITRETPVDSVDLVVSDGKRVHLLRTPKLGAEFNGAGDMIAALLLFHYLRKRDTADALAAVASSVFGILRRTLEAGARELALIPAQDELVSPSHRFAAEPIGDIA